MFETGDLDLDFQGQICHESSNVCVIPCHKLVNVINIEPLLCRPPVGWGSTYCFTDVCVSVLVRVTPINKGTPAQIFLGGMLFVPWAIGF